MDSSLEFSFKRFLRCYLEADVSTAAQIIREQPKLASQSTENADDSLLLACVHASGGHCYRKAHMEIADLLLSTKIKELRRALLKDDTRLVRRLLQPEPSLVHAPLVAGRGVAQPMHHAVSVTMVGVLSEFGAEVNAQNTVHEGETPLNVQLRAGRLDCACRLLEGGADPNLNPVMHVPSDQLHDAIELLLSYGWDIAAGNQLLHDANHGHGKRVATWLSFGVDPNQCDAEGATALHLFARRGIGVQAVRKLLECGADVTAKDQAGLTALQIAETSTKKAVAELLADFQS